ncbi:MAG: hypothetical protein M1355_00355 [Patescibacteria group bacterium]|nr:hypothetical protein [Patescibacteria group bacterium]
MDERTAEILSALVREYIDTGLPVGSFTLREGYGFSFSSATIRAEMAMLEELGFLTHPHTSAGRIPTEKGYRFFVENFLEEDALSQREEDVLEKKISSQAGFGKMLDAAAQVVTEITTNAGITGANGIIYRYGISNLLRQPEARFSDFAVGVAEIFDRIAEFIREVPKDEEFQIYIGRENPIGKNANCSMIVSCFETPEKERGLVGVLGPTRMNYDRNKAVIEIVKKIFEKSNKN